MKIDPIVMRRNFHQFINIRNSLLVAAVIHDLLHHSRSALNQVNVFLRMNSNYIFRCRHSRLNINTCQLTVNLKATIYFTR